MYNQTPMQPLKDTAPEFGREHNKPLKSHMSTREEKVPTHHHILQLETLTLYREKKTTSNSCDNGLFFLNVLVIAPC